MKFFEFPDSYTEWYKYCPNCGTLWDGVFDVRHKKYPLPNNCDWKNPGYSKNPKTGELDKSDKPRLVIEYGEIIDRKLHDNWFCLVKCEPELRWYLLGHCEQGSYLYENTEGCSSSVHMMKSYKEYSKRYPILRLKLVNKNYCKTIKEQGVKYE
jgi:hypothetical protein